MGQFIAVSSGDSERANNALSRCITAAEPLFSQTLRSQYSFGNIAVATFARHAVDDDSGRLRVFKDVHAWCLGVGTWIHHGGLSPEQQSYRLAAHHGVSGKLEASLAEFDGSYCFLIGSTTEDSLQVVTDPVGQLHVYGLQLAGATLISTSALLLAHIGDRSWDPVGVREFLAKGSVYEERSLFRGVKKIPPATIQSCEKGTWKDDVTYWSVRDHAESSVSAQGSLEQFSSATQASVTDAFRRFGNPALDLTGGFDSRILLGAGRKACPDQPLHTVVTGPKDSPDVVAATHIAQQLGLDHERLDGSPDSVEVWWNLAKSALPLVDGEYNILEYANIMFIHQQLAGRYGVSLNGSGGELIRGYWWELLFPRIGARNHFDAHHVALRRYATDPWAEHLLACNYDDTLTAHFASVIERANSELSGCRNTACMDNVYLRLRMHRWQGRIASATNRIWPCLSPLLFRAPMEAALRAPVSLRRNGRMARRLLASMDYQLAGLPMAGGYPALPITTTTLPQFLPLANEYFGRISNRIGRTIMPSNGGIPTRQSNKPSLLALDEVEDMLDPASMLTAELYETDALQELVAAIDQGGIPTTHIGRILTLEAVARLRHSLGD